MLWIKRLICIGSCLLLVDFSRCLILDGELSTDKADWKFLARFCFRKSLAKMTFHFEYPEEYCCQNILLYFDSQWKDVYPGFNKNCTVKEGALVPEYNQKVVLKQDVIHSGCHRLKDHDGRIKLSCGGRRSFLSIRARWWYIVVSNCKTTKGLKLRYRIELTNGNTFWTRHFSADEQYILETDIVFLVAFFVLFFLGIFEATMLSQYLLPEFCKIYVYVQKIRNYIQILASRKLFHYTYKLFLWSSFFELLSLIFYVAYYTDYGSDGKPNIALKVLGQAAHYIGHIVFLIMIILLAKGWTVTRGRISSSGQVKLAIFSTLYCISFVVLFIYERLLFDPGKVLYIYESPAGVGICILRLLGWLWFCYATFFTLKHFPKKTSFYYPFWFSYTGWFLVGPTMVLFAAYVIDDYQREQIVNGIEWGISLVAHAVFLILTRPAAANSNFPFHMRTCQIGVSEPDNNNESNYAYAPDNFIGAFTTQTFSIFQTSGTQRSEVQGPNNRNSDVNENRTEFRMATLSANRLENTAQGAYPCYPPPSYTQTNGFSES